MFKFTIGFITGLTVGAYLFDNMTEEQRSRIGGATTSAVQRVKSTKVVESVTGNVAQVADAASDRIADAVDSTGEKISDAVSPADNGHVTA